MLRVFCGLESVQEFVRLKRILELLARYLIFSTFSDRIRSGRVSGSKASGSDGVKGQKSGPAVLSLRHRCAARNEVET